MSEELVLRHTGEIVRLDDENACATALRALRDHKREIDEAIAVLSDALVQASERHGSKTMHLNTSTVTIAPSTKTLFDADALEHDLREAGMPEDRIRQIVKEEVTVSRKVVAGEAKRAASASAVYRDIIERHSTVVAVIPQVTVK
jgi:hypothetical protein